MKNLQNFSIDVSDPESEREKKKSFKNKMKDIFRQRYII